MNARTHAGFTLLELVVVIAIFGVMSVMAYGGLNSVLKSRQQVEQHMARTAQFQRTYRLLRDDLQQVRNRPARDSFGDAQPPLRGDREQRFEFTRAGWRNPLLLPRPGLERVSYRVNDKQLLRESWRVLDQAQDSKLVSLALLDRVDDLRVRYLASSREWSEQWPPLSSTGQAQTTSTAPLAVEITLETPDWGPVVFLFRLGMDVLPAGLALGGVPSGSDGTAAGASGGATTGGSATGGGTGGTASGDGTVQP